MQRNGKLGCCSSGGKVLRKKGGGEGSGGGVLAVCAAQSRGFGVQVGEGVLPLQIFGVREEEQGSQPTMDGKGKVVAVEPWRMGFLPSRAGSGLRPARWALVRPDIWLGFGLDPKQIRPGLGLIKIH